MVIHIQRWLRILKRGTWGGGGIATDNKGSTMESAAGIERRIWQTDLCSKCNLSEVQNYQEKLKNIIFYKEFSG